MFYLLGKPHNGEYVYPCPNNGKCTQLYFERMGFKWETFYSDHGVIRIEKDDEENKGFKTYIGNYKCCQSCHKPLNQGVATELNAILGIELNSSPAVADDDFLELLNDF